MTEKKLTRIEKIKVTGLLGKYDFTWELDPKVNILIGINGSGKSTLLKTLYSTLKNKYYEEEINSGRLPSQMEIFFNQEFFFRWDSKGFPPGANFISFPIRGDFERSKVMTSYFPGNTNVPFGTNASHVISDLISVSFLSTFEVRLGGEFISREEKRQTQLDKELSFLLSDYTAYQLGLLKKVEQLFLETEDINIRKKREEIYGKKIQFIESLNHLFSKTEKIADTDQNEQLIFLQKETILSPYQLSSGEKQLLLILLKTLLQKNRPAILLMDEPEVSLHLEWQEELIDIITKLNENVQIIMATHSPGIMMKGWLDKVTEMDTLLKG